MRKLAALLALFALLPFAFAACGGDDDDESDTAAEETTTTEEADTGGDAGGSGGGGTVSVSAAPDGSLAFEESSLSATAGANTFEFTNPADLAHDFCVEGESGDLGCTDLISGGDTSTLDADVEAGDYTYYCSVAGHREGGMEGTLTVE
jgi:plastocyanin